MGEHLQIPETEPATNSIKIGSIVEILYEGDTIEDAQSFQVVGWRNEGSTGEVSRTIRADSELGKAIIGKAAGENVRYRGPEGDTFSFEILSVANNESEDTESTEQ
jgi:transcription elongation GreA/GreB family factor